MSKKWNSPLVNLLNNGENATTVETLAEKKLAERVFNEGQKIEPLNYIPSRIQTVEHNTVIKVDPKLISNWELHDRKSYELGDLNSLAEDIKTNGQQQPCIVRPYNGKENFLYELIAGERRWRACLIASITIEVIVKKLSDQEAAFCQISENANREDICDYSKGMNYSLLIEKGIITQKDLEIKAALTQAQVSRFLSFSHVPKVIWDAIDDVSKISARTAAEIRSIANKSAIHKEALIHLAPRIRTGKLGEKSLKQEVEAYIQGSNISLNSAEEVKNLSGRHLFTWRNDSNNNISISFPKDIRPLLDKDKLGLIIINGIESMINERASET